MAKHLTKEERIIIAGMLTERASFKAIGRAIDKDCTTISKEIRNHRIYKRTGAAGKGHNACSHRYDCDHRLLCSGCTRSRSCRNCRKCNSMCPDFEEDRCERLETAPYVCNGCPDRSKCTLQKCIYDAHWAHKEYRTILSEARTGTSLSAEEIEYLDQLISPLLRKGQSFHHIYENNKDAIMTSERTLYRLISYNLFHARNIDLPYKTRRPMHRQKNQRRVDRHCRTGRTYEDFLKFKEQHPNLPVAEIDSVEGRKGGKVLLTIHFVQAEFMLAYIRDVNDAHSVTNIFEKLYQDLCPDRFIECLPILLSDNGSEFSDPEAIEFDRQGNRRTHLFYCDTAAPYQKGSAERNHELIRYILPRGRSFNRYSQKEISHMMDHINSYSRRSLGGKCPYEVFARLYGQDILDLLGCERIAPNDVTLNASLFQEAVLI